MVSVIRRTGVPRICNTVNKCKHYCSCLGPHLHCEFCINDLPTYPLKLFLPVLIGFLCVSYHLCPGVWVPRRGASKDTYLVRRLDTPRSDSGERSVTERPWVFSLEVGPGKLRDLSWGRRVGAEETSRGTFMSSLLVVVLSGLLRVSEKTLRPLSGDPRRCAKTH